MFAKKTSRTAHGESHIVRAVPQFRSSAVPQAAELQGRSISDILVAAALKHAHQTIEDAQIIRLSVDDQQRFADLLLNPPPLAPAMQRALTARRRLIANAQ
jgi:uncharacterized protein (DUF1778 family)